MTTAATRFDSFNIHTTSYKSVGSHAIEVNLLVPKALKSGKAPLHVKFHGGGLVVGTAMYPDWVAAWVIPFCLRNNAVTILPNYRLLPESNGKDIMEDLSDFWKWFDNDLTAFAKSHLPEVELDFDHVLVSGESAGGLLALQSAIHNRQNKFKAILGQYPMTSYLRRDGLGNIAMGQPVPGPEKIEQHLATMKPGVVVSSASPSDIPITRMMLGTALAGQGRWKEFFGDAPDLLPMTAVDEVNSLPPILILHGEQDSAVNVDDSRAFAEKAKGKGEVNLVVRPGDHGFDVELNEDDEPWLKDALQWVEGKWLS
ncbi:alpha/beta-hydrolase [Lophiostoma macrostomum CBS 122681]|uniref:Alpha/beta-hydrolase n=1 Tax=Lophiostoma macrostomum CBS 122681 TaxID=1314788 RepID=A0A6A6TJS2_9PLEO|nr:alpha/beta-hydrolase [Lophiostoma macrostomum CBS 122681]